MLRSHGISRSSPEPAAKVRRHHEDDFNFLSKMCLTRMREVAWQMARQAHAIGAVTIAHGSDASDHSAEYLQHGFDRVISGEAEWKLAETCRQFAKVTDAEAVPSIPRPVVVNAA